MTGENIKRILSGIVLVPLVILAVLKLPTEYLALLILPLILIATSEVNKILKIGGNLTYLTGAAGLYLIYIFRQIQFLTSL